MTKVTKRALLTSALALVVCVSMLIGTTYAWFTDSVTSANNIIKSGNLDIVLEYWNGTEWVDVEGKSDILTNKNFEPGVTEVAYLRLANEGSLALKYQLGINVVSEKAGVNAAGDSFKLSDYIQFGVVENVNADAFATREAAVAALTESKKISAGYTKAAAMDDGAELYFALVVYMPETVGNVANHDGTNVPQIDLGINVFATQKTSEEDSFGNDYDGGAVWTGEVDTTWYNTTDTEFVLKNAEEFAGFAAIVNSTIDSFAGKTVKLSSNIDLNNLAWTPIGDVDAADFVGFQGTFDGNGKTISNLNIDSTSWGQGLFGYMTTNVTIKNFKVNNAYVNASDCAGVVVGYATSGTFENIAVTGDVTVIGTVADGHVGGIAGCGYNANFINCSVISENGSITSKGSFVGGIVGYQCNNTKTISGCTVKGLTITGDSSVGGISGIIQAGGNGVVDSTVENVDLYKKDATKVPSIGALCGQYTGAAETKLTNNTVKNVTINDTSVEYTAYNVLYGTHYDDATGTKGHDNFDTTGTTVDVTRNSSVVNSVVKSAAELQAAIDNDVAYIVLGANITGDVTVTQKPNVKITIDGNGNTFAGVITVDGKSATYTTAGLTVKNVVFKADSISADACIRLGDGTNATRYTCNVTVDNCTFDVAGAVGVKSYTGGDKNLVIKNSTATAKVHSLAQLKGIEGVLIDSCTVNSVRGINFNNSLDVVIKNSTINVQKYAVRFGEGNNSVIEQYEIIDSKLVSANVDGDAAIVLRAGAIDANLVLTNTEVIG